MGRIRRRGRGLFGGLDREAHADGNADGGDQPDSQKADPGGFGVRDGFSKPIIAFSRA